MRSPLLVRNQPRVEQHRQRNIRSVSNRFTLTHGAFEDYVAEVLTAPMDVAFVDAIHGARLRNAAVRLLEPRMSPGGVILFDDIDFKSNW